MGSKPKKVIRLRTLAARADTSTLKKFLFLGTMTLLAALALLTLTPGSEACERRRLTLGMLHFARFGTPKAAGPKNLRPKCSPSQMAAAIRGCNKHGRTVIGPNCKGPFHTCLYNDKKKEL